MSDAAVAGQKGERIALLKVLGPDSRMGARRRHRPRRRIHGVEFLRCERRRVWFADRLLDHRPAVHVRGHDRLRSDLDGRRRRWPVHAGEAHHRAADGVQRGPVSRHGVHDARGGGRARGGRPIKAVAADSGYPGLDSRPFALVTIAFLAWLNYRGVFVTLTVNFVITSIAFVAIVVLFLGVQPWHPGRRSCIASC